MVASKGTNSHLNKKAEGYGIQKPMELKAKLKTGFGEEHKAQEAIGEPTQQTTTTGMDPLWSCTMLASLKV